MWHKVCPPPPLSHNIIYSGDAATLASPEHQASSLPQGGQSSLHLAGQIPWEKLEVLRDAPPHIHLNDTSQISTTCLCFTITAAHIPATVVPEGDRTGLSVSMLDPHQSSTLAAAATVMLLEGN